MINLTYIFDYKSQSWQRCLDKKIAESDIEHLPLLINLEDYCAELFFGHYYYFSGFWLVEKNRPHFLGSSKEEIKDLIPADAIYCELSNNDEDCINRIAGCRNDIMHVRWRIYQEHEEGVVFVAADTVNIVVRYDYGGVSPTVCERKTYTMYFNPVDETFRRFPKDGYEKNIWESMTLLDDEDKRFKEFFLPAEIADEIINVFRLKTKTLTGIYPSMTSRLSGLKKVAVFLERPFDIHIDYLKNFLGLSDFNEKFPKDSKDNYRPLCEMLGINKPPKSLRKAYGETPYAIIAYLIMTRLGFRDINIIRCFYDKLNIGCFNVLYMHWNFEIGDFAEDYQEFKMICTEGIKLLGETQFAKTLSRLSKVAWPTYRGMSTGAGDIMHMLYTYMNVLPDALKLRVYKSEWDRKLHDWLVEEMSDIDPNTYPNIRIIYNDKELGLECVINGYEVNLVHDTVEVMRLGRLMNNCVGGYKYRVEKKECYIAYIRKDAHYEACIEIDTAMSEIYQAVGNCNSELGDEVLDVFLCWCKLKNLDPCRIGIYEDRIKERWDSINVSDYMIGPSNYKKVVEEMNFMELLKNENMVIDSDYFKLLHKALLKQEKTSKVAPPPWIKFKDELTYLRFVLPEGEKIFTYAYNGEREAQLLLAAMYRDGKYVEHSQLNESFWLCKACGADRALLKADYLKEPYNMVKDDLIRNGLVAALGRISHEAGEYGYNKYIRKCEEFARAELTERIDIV